MKNIKIKLLANTPNMLDIVYTGARTCYNAGSPIDMWFDVCNIPNDKKQSLLRKVLGSGHQSCLEHCSVTFAIEGVSRTFLAQISRHRFVQLSVQSQRYVQIKEDLKYIDTLYDNYNPVNYEQSDLAKTFNKYFIDGDKKENVHGFYFALNNYLESISNGEKAEDARRFLPNATRTNMVISMNLRELVHVSNLRCCSRAQLEIRKVVNEMCKLVINKEPWLAEYIGPSCKTLGYCPESHSCGRKTSLHDIIDHYNSTNIYDSKDDYRTYYIDDEQSEVLDNVN